MTTDTQLEALRQEIDRIDDAMHDLLVRRTLLVEQVGAAKAQDGVALRPGREATILRRLAARHKGAFPLLALVRIWREIMGAHLGLQRPFSVAVCQPERGAGYIEMARNHFGVVCPIHVHTSPGQVVRAIADGQASVGVLPIPREGVGVGEAWWLSLTAEAGNLPRVIGRLPFLASESGSTRAEPLEALVIACRGHEETGADRTLLAVETPPGISRDRLRAALAAGGLDAAALIATRRDDDAGLHLAEIAGYVSDDDGRVAQLVAAKDPVLRITVLGGWAEPLSL